ncbi:dehydrogenase/reductase SDR family member 11-like [Diadema setosum]|uniref:dehydrogenase/reductase SDR family member 11-like n=1 Tax=Diadema setosum TaxID=31175 RepID=UPI003B3BAA8D
MDRWEGRVALVTGASAGIGAAVVRLLVKHGMKVVGCARNVDKMKALADEVNGGKGSFHPIQCDLSKREQIPTMFETIRTEHGGVDVCINNAGLSFRSPLLEAPPEEMEHSLNVNVLALCMCTNESIKQMRERGVDDGHVIMLNSLAGHRVIVGVNSLHFYSGTKHMVTALTEGYRDELRQLKSRIRVTAISPGLVETEFSIRQNAHDPEKGKNLYNELPCLKADDIAELVAVVLQQPPHVQIHDLLVRDTDQKY